MSFIRLKSGSSKWVPQSMFFKRLSSSPVEVATQDLPQYPPIVEMSPLAIKLRQKKKWHDWLRSHDTVEEKLFELNMPKYWGWHSVSLTETTIPYNILPWVQFACRTHLEVSDKEIPFYANPALDNLAAKIASDLKTDVEDVILFEYNDYRKHHSLQIVKEKELRQNEVEELYIQSFVKHLNRVLLTGIANEAKYLNLTTVVPEPRVEAFWFLGGVNPTQEKLEERRRRTKMTNRNVVHQYLDPSLVDGPVNEPIQFHGKPILQLQTKYPLPSVEDLLDANPQAKGILHVPYEPSVFYLEKDYKRATIIPGFWPGESHEFGMMSFHSNNFVKFRSFGPEDRLEATHSSAILSSFAWLLAQACYQGFSIFHDVTYPLSTQTVQTNGKDWSFYLYQLNTTLLHTKNSTENPRCNLCWGTTPASLFQEVQDGRVIGLNEEVLKKLIKLYLIEPKVRKNVQMKPFLAEKPYVADIEFEERRNWLEERYKFLTSNRKWNKEKPEVYAWEQIFRIKHNDMPRMRRTEWYMTQGPPPDCRRLDDHTKIYKPKALRTEEDLKYVKQIQKFQRQFYPGTNKEKILPPGK